MADEEVVEETPVEPKPAKAKAAPVAEHPDWYKELVAGTRHVIDESEPEAVTRARGE